MQKRITLLVGGIERSLTIDTRITLLDALRNQLRNIVAEVWPRPWPVRRLDRAARRAPGDDPSCGGDHQ